MSERFKIRWTHVAIADLDSILDYIAIQESAPAAAAVGEKLLEAAESLRRHPRRGRLIPELKAIGLKEFRELILRPYRLPFRIHRDKVVILGVFDGRRDLEDILVDRASGF